MGGMGTIHPDNDFILYQDNHTMTANILQASIAAGIQRFAYASSACVYPEELQCDHNGVVSLKESDVWAYPPPKPQGLYGLEKLASELLIHHFSSRIDVKIARFHNIYGPKGSWCDGREKAPAALLRKALVSKHLHDDSTQQLEIWGDGNQRRSFLYIDDAVEGFLKLLDSNESGPFNIGSDNACTIRQLAEVALECAGKDREHVSVVYDISKPTGVACRNSNNDQVGLHLGWSPGVTLADGMQRTGEWIDEQIRGALNGFESNQRKAKLRDWLSSKVVQLEPERITMGILLPVTSRGSANPNDCLDNLRRFAQSLVKTTLQDTTDGRTADVIFRCTIYLAVDKDDYFLCKRDDGGFNKAERVLKEEVIFDIVTLYCDHPRGHVCKIWRDCARKAFMDKCDYMVLMGDDVILKDEGWIRSIHKEFVEISRENNLPLGFGCVAFTDISFPGMPTFPVIHRTHMDIFNGDVIPDIFVNQDGDPYLFQLYRRWGCSRMVSARLSNSIGGEEEARYEKQSATNWTFGTIDNGVSTAESWLSCQGVVTGLKKLTLDIIIPCYRVNIPILERILALEPFPSCSVTFIIIIDDPSSPHIFELKNKFGPRPDVRIRINKTNLGASASRNKGIDESAAEWVHFLDDDVVPREDLLKEAEKIIRTHSQAAGFVGSSVFPVSNSIFTTAVHLAGVTYFWDIASKLDGNAAQDVPWGVTANLIARRNLHKDNSQVKFDPSFPKTGGGEDIHFCRIKRKFSLQEGAGAFCAAPEVRVVHPWWNGGRRSYWRFYNWSVGDGALIKQFPEHVYPDFAPNSAESMLFCSLGICVSIVFAQTQLFAAFWKAFVCVAIANVLFDCYRHLYKHPERNASINTNLQIYSVRWILAVIESSFIRMFSEIGRVRGMIGRGEYSLLGRRFDWFAGTNSNAIKEERSNSVQRIVLAATLFLIVS